MSWDLTYYCPGLRVDIYSDSHIKDITLSQCNIRPILYLGSSRHFRIMKRECSSGVS